MWGGMRFLLQIALGMQVNECCENPNKYQFKGGFILFPCQEVYLSGWRKATKDQASWLKVEPQRVPEKAEGNLTFQIKIREVAQWHFPLSMGPRNLSFHMPWGQPLSQILTLSSHKWEKWWYSSPSEDIQVCCLQNLKHLVKSVKLIVKPENYGMF